MITLPFSFTNKGEWRAAVGLLHLLNQNGHKATSFWSTKGFHLNATAEDIKNAFADVMWGEGDTAIMMSKIKQTKQPYSSICTVGGREYLELAQKAQSTHDPSRWVAFAGMNVGRASFMSTYAELACAYFSNHDLLAEDVSRLIAGQGSVLNLKTAKTKIGGEDSPVRSGGVSLGKYGQSEFVVSPLAFILGLEAMNVLGVSTISGAMSEGEPTIEASYCLEVEPAPMLVSKSAIFDRIGGATFLAPVWTKETSAQEVLKQLDKIRVTHGPDWRTTSASVEKKRESAAVRNRAFRSLVKMIRNSDIFTHYSLFLVGKTDADQNNNIATLCRLVDLRGNDTDAATMLSFSDLGLSTNSIASLAGFSSFDEFVKSDWSRLVRSSQSRRNVEGAYTGGTEDKEERDVINYSLLSHPAIFERTPEFAAAVMLRLVSWHQVFSENFDKLQALSEWHESLYYPAFVHRDVIVSLQYDMELLDERRVIQHLNLLSVFSLNQVKKLAEEKKDELKMTKFLVDGENVSLLGLPVQGNWKKVFNE